MSIRKSLCKTCTTAAGQKFSYTSTRCNLHNLIEKPKKPKHNNIPNDVLVETHHSNPPKNVEICIYHFGNNFLKSGSSQEITRVLFK